MHLYDALKVVIIYLPAASVTIKWNKSSPNKGGIPGLWVMGDESCSRARGFKSQCCILDGHDIFHIDLL